MEIQRPIHKSERYCSPIKLHRLEVTLIRDKRAFVANCFAASSRQLQQLLASLVRLIITPSLFLHGWTQAMTLWHYMCQG